MPSLLPTTGLLLAAALAPLPGCMAEFDLSPKVKNENGNAVVPTRSADEAEPSAAEAGDGSTAETAMNQDLQIATFGAGCFWGVEAAYRQVKGVKATSVGFMGGDVNEPSYKQVCTTPTGHAEVVRVEYDPREVDYERLLEVFWENHDPTQLNRQGPDVGAQYRSVIFFHDAAQEAAARASKEALEASGRFKRPVVTEIVPATDYWVAEEYHQQYLEKRGLSQCHM